MTPSKPEHARRRNLVVNVLQAICILTFVACVAIDPELRGIDPGASPEVKTAAR